MKEIKLTKGKFALVDDEDFERINQYKWQAIYKKDKKIYIAKRSRTKKESDSPVYILMHRQIMNINNSKIQVDHINHNTLDNRRCNLRLCNNSQNNMNKKGRSDNTSEYKGVSFYHNKFHAEIMVNQKSYRLGSFDTAIEAAKAYNAKALELHKEFAYLNKV